MVTDGINVQTSRGVIPFNALKPNIDGPSQCILPTDAGSRIGIMYVPQAGCPDKAEMHFIINGEDQGVCGKDIPYKAGPLRAVVDVYGTTKQVRIVQLYGGECSYCIVPISFNINFIFQYRHCRVHAVMLYCSILRGMQSIYFLYQNY